MEAERKRAKLRVLELISCSNKFGFKLHRKLANEEGNVVFSPFDVSAVLLSALCGTSRRVAPKFMESLGFDCVLSEKVEVINALCHISRWIKQEKDFHNYTVENALIYFPESLLVRELRAKLQRIVTMLFCAQRDSSLNNLADPEVLIDDWVFVNKRDFFDDFNFDSNCPMVLFNAVSLDYNWKHKFHSSFSHTRTFYNNGDPSQGKDVPMVFLVQRVLFAQTEAYKLIELPSVKNDFVMGIILPREMNGLDRAIKNFEEEYETLKCSLNGVVNVELAMPKFNLEYSRELYSIISDFDDAEDVPANPDNSVFLQLMHRTSFKMEEDEPSSLLTTLSVAFSMEMKQQIYCDHPFMFYTYDYQSGLMLSIGHIRKV